MPEQITEEDLKNMSPEQILAFQKQNCIFCQIISSKIPSNKVYEDSIFLAILDINPANSGHILLLTKEHYAIMPQMPDDVVRKMGIVLRNLSNAIIKGLKVEGTSLFIANGPAAGQRANHFMAHIIPRLPGDGLFQTTPNGISSADVTKLAAAISGKPIEHLNDPEKSEVTEEIELTTDITQDSNPEEDNSDDDTDDSSTNLDNISKILGV